MARRIVREAKVDFIARDVIAVGLEVGKLALSAGGFIEQKDIQFESLERKVKDLGKGKLWVYEKVCSYVQMTVRVLLLGWWTYRSRRKTYAQRRLGRNTSQVNHNSQINKSQC